MFVLKRANIACRQQMTTVNLLQKNFKQFSYYTASNWYYNSIQLLSVSMVFTGMLCLQIYCGWLLKEFKKIYQKLKKSFKRDCLEHHCERSLKLCDWSSTQVSLSPLTGKAGIVNVQGCDMHLYLSWLAN